MLWSLLKILLFVVLVAAAALGASLLLEMGGAIRLAATLDLALELGDAVAIGAQPLEQRPKLRNALVRLVDPEIARHGRILALA